MTLQGRLLITAAIAILGATSSADAIPAIDQQQPIIDTSVGPLAIGGASAQKVAQVVTAGMSGFLTIVRFPVTCDASSKLIVEIQGVAAGVPNSAVPLTSQTVDGTSLPPFAPSPPSFRSLTLSNPIYLTAGTQFAIVLKSSGSCQIFRGPLGDSYSGGNLYIDSNQSGWSIPGDRFDLPFQTAVEPLCTPPAISNASATPSSLWPPNHKMEDIAVDYTVAGTCPTSCTLNVVSNEAINGLGDGNTTVDWIVVDPKHVRLRSERSGNGDGRIYTVTIACTNSASQFASENVKVTVAHDRGK